MISASEAPLTRIDPETDFVPAKADTVSNNVINAIIFFMFISVLVLVIILVLFNLLPGKINLEKLLQKRNQ